MLRNGGRLDGTRLLSPTTVAFMTSDHLGPMQIVPLDLQGAPGPARGYTGTLFRQMVRPAISE